MRATSSVRTGCDTRLLIVVALSACGRIGFDPTTTATSDARVVGDGAGSSQPIDDAPLTACNFGIPIEVGTRLPVNTCTGRNLIKGCSANDREEVVIDFVPPTTGGYTVRAFNPGTTTVSSSTGVVNIGCGTVSTCSGLFGTTFNAGEHYYFAYEGSVAVCIDLEILID